MKHAIVTDYKRFGSSLKVFSRSLVVALKIFGFFLQGLLAAWPTILFLALFLLPQTPHMLLSYTYRPVGNERIYLDCHYFGIRGFHRTVFDHDCPMIAFIGEDP